MTDVPLLSSIGIHFMFSSLSSVWNVNMDNQQLEEAGGLETCNPASVDGTFGTGNVPL